MKATIDRVMQWTLGSALGLIAIAAVLRPAGLFAAIAGAGLAVISTAALVGLSRVLVERGASARAPLAFLLLGKSALVLVATAAILFVGQVDAAGFALGVSALVSGTLGGSIHAFLTGGPDPRDGLTSGARDA